MGAGQQVVYVKNTDYVPRKEAPSGMAGGKVVKVDRVEWIYIPDSATAAAALNAGEADWWEQLPPDLIPLLRQNKDIRVENIDPLGSLGIMRFNFLQPPFNNQKLRQALLYVVNQKDYVIGIAGDEKNGRTCYSFFTCGTPLSTEAGAEPLKGKRDFDRARKLIQESGYKGEKIVMISATDQPIVHSQSLLTADTLRKLGLNVELQAGDWGTLITRRTSKEPVEKGGWSIFHTWAVGPDMVSPANFAMVNLGVKAWFGWPADAKLEELRQAWFDTTDAAAAKKAAEAVQLEAFSFASIHEGSSSACVRSTSGVILRPSFLWNVEKSEGAGHPARHDRLCSPPSGRDIVVMAVVALVVLLLFLTPGDPAADRRCRHRRYQTNPREAGPRPALPGAVRRLGVAAGARRSRHVDLHNLPVTTLIGQRVQPTSLTLARSSSQCWSRCRSALSPLLEPEPGPIAL
jgi:peptide/nickel transport system substrate-binding protein